MTVELICPKCKGNAVIFLEEPSCYDCRIPMVDKAEVSGFEKWAVSQGLDISPNNRTGLGYWYENTQSFWMCWQAAKSKVES